MAKCTRCRDRGYYRVRSAPESYSSGSILEAISPPISVVYTTVKCEPCPVDDPVMSNRSFDAPSDN